MKIKYFVLLAICSVFCALGCSCNKEQSQGGAGSSTDSSTADSSSEEIVDEINPIISVNQSSVTFCVGETFTLVAESENVVDAEFVWMIDGDYDNGIVSLSQTDNTALITALKPGTTKLVASVEWAGHIYFKTIDVTVKEGSDVVLLLSENIGFDEKGYHVRLSTLSTENGDVTSIVPLVTAYKNNKIVAVDIDWESADTSVVVLDGNKFVSAGEGETTVSASCVVDGKEYVVDVSVEVYRPTISLTEKFVVEVENLSEIGISSAIKGVARDVLYDGKSVGDFDVQSKMLTLTKELLPTDAALMGENKILSIETSLASYTVNIDLYTKIINTKEEFEGMAALSKACSSDAAIWNGYFVLGADIDYNGKFVSKIADIDSLWAAVGGNWSNGGLYGFKGVFDGKGHNIEGISIDNGSSMASIFGVLHIDGVVKNVSFTKASVAANSSFVCQAGGGTVENIYIQYDSIGKGTQHYESDGVTINNHCGSFFSYKEPTPTANVSNCVIDITNAFVNAKVSVKVVGSEYVAIKNVFVIGGTEAVRNASNATLTESAVIDFVENTNAQNRYAKFDDAFWSKANGVPVSNAVYAETCDNDVQFTETVGCLVAGTSYKFLLNNAYTVITSDNENVVISGNTAIISDNVQGEETVVIKASSIFDSTKFDTFTCILSEINYENCIDLTTENTTAFYDITEDKVYFAELGEKIDDEILYFVNSDYSAVTFAEDGEEAKTILAVAKNRLYKVNCLSVTKVIAKAEDLHYIRRDYTVSSYGNKGCYDGKLTGTFVLIGDIDCTGLELKNSGKYWENSRGFGGVFDGRGYTISNLSVGENGLFGALAYATIKNVNFTNIRLKAADQGAYVCLFAPRVFDTLIENVSMQFAEYVASEDIYHTSGLMFYETAFDNLFKDLTIDISQISGVKYLTEAYYVQEGSALPYLSEEKSVYENITVIVADIDEIPVFAYKAGAGTEEDTVDYPEGCFTFKNTSGDVIA